MDKYDLVLDIIEHPDKYTAKELSDIMADSETKEIYHLLCKVDSAVSVGKEVDVDKEWKNFSRKAGFRRRGFLMKNSRAASIITVICSSIVAMAVGIAVTVAVTDHKTEITASVKVEQDASVAETDPADSLRRSESAAEIEESKVPSISPILFEDEPLSVIMETISTNYGVKVRFENEDVASLHLYYKFDSSLSLDEVIAQLNTFESINITPDKNLLIIE